LKHWQTQYFTSFTTIKTWSCLVLHNNQQTSSWSIMLMVRETRTKLKHIMQNPYVITHQ